MSTEKVKPAETLRAAAQHMDDRAVHYDQKGGERSIEKVVTMFNALHGTNLTIAQGWNFMEILKMVRGFTGTGFTPSKKDSGEDQVAYTALRLEAQSEEK